MLSFYNANVKMRIISVVNKGNYSQIKGKTARKDKATDEWHNSTWAFVNFVGTAHKKIDDLIDALEDTEKYDNGDSKTGVWILLDSVSFENASWKDASGETKYPKNYKITVFAWKFPEDSAGGIDKPPVVAENEVDEDEFPF